MAIDFRRTLEILTGAEIQFILVGGFAATLHGSARGTLDVDVVYARGDENLNRIIAGLRPHQPYLRGAPPGLPFQWDVETLRAGLNFTLTTDFGDLDLLGEIAGGGGFEELLPHAEARAVHGVKLQCLSLEKLIEVKRAAGRPKDFEAVAELEALLEERDKD